MRKLRWQWKKLQLLKSKVWFTHLCKNTTLIYDFNFFLVIVPVTEETKATEQTTIEDVVIVEETTDTPQSTPKEEDWEATTENLFGS